MCIRLAMIVVFASHFDDKFSGELVPDSVEIFKLGEISADTDSVNNRDILQFIDAFFVEDVIGKMLFKLW